MVRCSIIRRSGTWFAGEQSMHPQQSHQLKPGTPVWIWVVRLARGRWWPGTVEGLRTIEDQLRVAVRFECRRATDQERAPVMVGITTTAMRYLELRDANARGLDWPHYTPVSLLERPEEGTTPREPVVGSTRSIEEDLTVRSMLQLANGNYSRN